MEVETYSNAADGTGKMVALCLELEVVIPSGPKPRETYAES